ncbi:hypothetical protein COCVIDRAFT_21064 [Bipolaris victoriae FI3]|uniref:LysM domain-containing protein n=1 Tax=Bipolaris victoriae (strain FI3) TaxID=930091 RepID=W7DRU7_BIPV3|nr:hypothetical protein COCVIDRAFT_21064 [Bipolaris victoriae FI3]
MQLLLLALLGLASASLIRRDWTCPALISGCTKSFLVTSGTCDSIAAANGLAPKDFYALNPSLNTPSCNNLYAGCSYCVAKGSNPSVCPTDYNAKCDKFHEVKTGDICQAIIQQNPPLSLDQLFAYNPSIHKPACDNLSPACKYCVHVRDAPKVPEPHQPNVRKDCKEYYQAVAGDYCYKISLDKGINLNDFMSWNPDVGPTCLNMLVGYWYCLRT